MGNGRVLPVLAVEDQHLLVNENGSIIQVQNNIQRQVTPGDYVNVENTLDRTKRSAWREKMIRRANMHE